MSSPTLPSYTPELLAKAQQIKLLVMDVDGVLSDGKVYYLDHGRMPQNSNLPDVDLADKKAACDEIKNFNIKDGLGIKLLQQHGIKTAIITGRTSAIVERRAHELGIGYVYQGHANKREAFAEIMAKEQLSESQMAHIGDDLPDLPLMKLSGLGITVQDGHWFVKQNADWITPSQGGQGAVRDTAELLLSSRNLLKDIHQGYLSS